ncbi:CP2 transcription factor [Penicillium argentinense]|uniref:CP2 transcription factor n=1 Tax=Penicillium argentinense TaxID=1131581 RepID=A0A9W9KK45_9EURO|nr:CP2 transcription factor [Penicillium argentinense]KAJ5109619.1 CP2 transcription factor [Penicillium argentinense]
MTRTSQSVQLLPPQSNDFDLFSTGSGLSPKGDIHSNINWSGGNQPATHFNQPYAENIHPSQLWNTPDPFFASTGYPPNHFTHRDSGYEAMDESQDPLYPSELPTYTGYPDSMEPDSADSGARDSGSESYTLGEKFRYHTTLRTSTATVDNPSDAPVTYLNKGQVYYIQVADSTPPRAQFEPTQYRTWIRITFDREEQRSDPTAYWRMWKEGRGSTESQNREDKMVAVEFAGQKNHQVKIGESSLDGFCVTWTVQPGNNIHRCTIPVRFNFLSTDFTHSKGVKGMSVRLCSKTEQLNFLQDRESEICFCKVKLFRDHGAERKLANDATITRKKIERLKKMLEKSEGPEPQNKRKRSSIETQSRLNHESGWTGGIFDSPPPTPFHDKQQRKLTALLKSLSSSRPESVFGIRGDSIDDPELNPIRQDEITSHKPDASQFKAPSQDGSSSSRPKSRLSTPENASSLSDEVNEALLAASKKSSPRRSVSMPVACFFIILAGSEPSLSQHYRAIYPRERTAQELVKWICEKYLVDPTTIARVLYTNNAGLEIIVDDDFVQEMAEGQSMVVEIGPPSGAETTSNTMQVIRLKY